MRAIRGQIILCLSPLVLEETERNLAEKAPEQLPNLAAIARAVPFERVQPDEEEVVTAARYVAVKDAPIVAAAARARVIGLVSFDRKHLLEQREGIERAFGLGVVLPEEALRQLDG